MGLAADGGRGMDDLKAGKRLIAVSIICGAGGAVYLATAFLIGGMNRDDVMLLLRRKKAATQAPRV